VPVHFAIGQDNGLSVARGELVTVGVTTSSWIFGPHLWSGVLMESIRLNIKWLLIFLSDVRERGNSSLFEFEYSWDLRFAGANCSTSVRNCTAVRGIIVRETAGIQRTRM